MRGREAGRERVIVSEDSPGCRIVVIGASAGGVQTAVDLLAGLGVTENAACFLVVHFPPDVRSVLPEILNRHVPMASAHAADNEPIHPGRIYVAPPDFHLILRDGRVQLTKGPKENRHRPSIDVLFRSAAATAGRNVVAVVLSGNLRDGAAGLAAVSAAGGVAVVQDPDDAAHTGMPLAALEAVPSAHVLTVARLPGFIRQVLESPAPAIPLAGTTAEAPAPTEPSPTIDHPPGTTSAFTCPDCHGALWETEDDGILRYQCRVGHAFSSDALANALDEGTENALWASVRILEERADLAARLARRAQEHDAPRSEGYFRKRAHESHSAAEAVRTLIFRAQALAGEDEPAP